MILTVSYETKSQKRCLTFKPGQTALFVCTFYLYFFPYTSSLALFAALELGETWAYASFRFMHCRLL